MTLVWVVPCSCAHGQSSRLLFMHQMWERFSALSLGAMAIPVMRPADREPSPCRPRPPGPRSPSERRARGRLRWWCVWDLGVEATLTAQCVRRHSTERPIPPTQATPRFPVCWTPPLVRWAQGAPGGGGPRQQYHLRSLQRRGGPTCGSALVNRDDQAH